MLQIVIPDAEKFDNLNERFFTIPGRTLQLEHSLVSLAKWEAKWCKPFLSKDTLSTEETIDYIKCMTLTQNVDPNVYYNIDNKIIHQVSSYIEAKMTATWFSEQNKKNITGINNDVITAEIIYYWMIALNIPFECQKWHLNRLLTLIKVCNIKNTPAKKMGKKDLLARNRALNEKRKLEANTKG